MKQDKLKIYAKALSDAISNKDNDKDKIRDNFLKLLIGNGLQNKLKNILDLAEDFILKKENKRKIVFETPRKMTKENRLLLEKIAKRGDIVKEKINPDLIAGVKITINNEKQFDNSMLSKLNQLL